MPMNTQNPSSVSILNKDEIPDHIKKVKETASATFWLLVTCLSYNLAAVTTLWLEGATQSSTLCLAIGYLLLGVPAAHFSWRRELNFAFEGDDRFSFARFFVAYVIHIGFWWFALFVPVGQKSLTTMFSGMAMCFEEGLAWVGIIYLIGSMLFFVEYVMSIRVISKVHELYKQGVFSYGDADDYYLEGTNGSINV